MRRAPLIAEIARQGGREGVFSTPFPDQTGELVLAYWQGWAFIIVLMMEILTQQRYNPVAVLNYRRNAAPDDAECATGVNHAALPG
ncbi:MAG TPA: hypothetical protein VNF29_06820, partial [Candidatus Binataceae bacterium]|nr:hypothetical protein [Candidatus Binataceae bacterium]